MKKKLLISLLSGAGIMAASAWATPSYQLASGYGTFNVNLTSDQPIEGVQFEYGNNTLGTVSLPQGYSVGTPVAISHGLYRYTISFESTSSWVKPAMSLTLGQIPYLGGSETKNMPFNEFYGFPMNITINGTKAELTNYPYGITKESIPDTAKEIGAYYADWTVYSGHNGYSVDQIPYNNVNMVIYGFGSINPITGSAQVLDPYADAQKSTGSNKAVAFPYLTIQRMVNPKLNVIYSFGGWGTVDTYNQGGVTPNWLYSSGDFSVLFQYFPEKIKTLADSMTSAIAKLGYNGVDIDYEWQAPAETQAAYLGGNTPLCSPQVAGQTCNPNPLTQQQANGYIELMYYLRQNMDVLHAENGQVYYLTNALMSGPGTLQQLTQYQYTGDLSAIKTSYANQNALEIIFNLVNYTHLMTYDMHGQFDAPGNYASATKNNVTDFQSQTNANDPHNPVDHDFSVEDTLNWLKHNTPKVSNLNQKISLGIPAYSRIVAVNPNHVTPVVSLPDSYKESGLYLYLNDQALQGTTKEAFGEFIGDVWTQDYRGNSTDTDAAHSIVQGIRGSGTFDYKCIVNNQYCYMQTSSAMSPQQLFTANEYFTPGTSADQPGFYAKTPWAYSSTNNVFMSYDDQNSTAAKIKSLVNQQNMAGAFVWEIDGDIPKTDSNYQKKSLIYSIYSNIDQQPTPPEPKTLVWQSKPTFGKITDNSASAQWQATIDGESTTINYGYVLKNNRGSVVATGSGVSADFSDLEANTLYSLTVTASAKGYDSITDTESFTTKSQAPTQALEWTTKPSISGITTDSATATWQAEIKEVNTDINYQYTLTDSTGSVIASGGGSSANFSDLSSDTQYSLTVTAAAAGYDSITDTETFTTKSDSGNTWDPAKIYNNGDTVMWNGIEYTAQWWTQGEEPGTSQVWKAPVVPGGQWSANAVYAGGDTVIYQGNKYQAKWWTQGDNPAQSGQDGPWRKL